MAGPEKPDKTQGGKDSGSQSSRRQKATRAPILDLEATEVKGAKAATQESGPSETSDKAEKAPETPEPKRDTKPDTKPDTAEKPRKDADPAAGEPEAAPKPAAKGATAPSLTTIAASALAGAILTGVVVITMGRMGILTPNTPVAPAPDLTALEARIQAVENAGPGTGVDAGLGDRLDKAEQATAQASEAATRLSEQLSALAKRLDDVDTRLAETESIAQSALGGQRSIEAAVREIGTRPADGSAGPSTEALELKIANLGQRLDRVVEESRTASGSDARVDGLVGELAELRSAIGQLRTDLAGVEGKVAQEQKAVADLGRGLEARLDAIDARLGGPGETRGAAAALALVGLTRSVLDGQPFAAELAAFKALVPDEPAIAVLEPHAGVGVPTRAELTAEFPELAKRIETPRTAGPDEGLGARIAARLQSIVTVRRTGDAAGDGPKAVIARMVRAVEMDDLEAAVAAGETAGTSLPEPAELWLEQVRARIAVEKALEEADGRMIAVLGRTGG